MPVRRTSLLATREVGGRSPLEPPPLRFIEILRDVVIDLLAQTLEVFAQRVLVRLVEALQLDIVVRDDAANLLVLVVVQFELLLELVRITSVRLRRRLAAVDEQNPRGYTSSETEQGEDHQPRDERTPRHRMRPPPLASFCHRISTPECGSRRSETSTRSSRDSLAACSSSRCRPPVGPPNAKNDVTSMTSPAATAPHRIMLITRAPLSASRSRRTFPPWN